MALDWGKPASLHVRFVVDCVSVTAFLDVSASYGFSHNDWICQVILRGRLSSPFQDVHILAGKWRYLTVLDFFVIGLEVSAGFFARHEAPAIMLPT